jgi:uncharacterized protein
MSQQSVTKVWILTDKRDGNTSQCLGVAQKLGYEFAAIDSDTLSDTGLEAFVKTHCIDVPSSQRTILISASPELTDRAARVKRLAGDRVFNVKLGTVNNTDTHFFDLIADSLPLPANRTNQKTIHTFGVAHKVTPQAIEQGKKEWEEQFSRMNRPIIALMVGGDIAHHLPFTPAMAKKLGSDINAFAQRNGASLVITDSRRTSPEAMKALCDQITVPSYIYQHDKTMENPYFGILGIADDFVVTGDSMSMMCEACATRKPVYIYPLPAIEMPSHHLLQSELENTGRARKFDGSVIEQWTHEPLDTAGDIAAAIQQKIKIKSMSIG